MGVGSQTFMREMSHIPGTATLLSAMRHNARLIFGAGKLNTVWRLLNGSRYSSGLCQQILKCKFDF